MVTDQAQPSSRLRPAHGPESQESHRAPAPARRDRSSPAPYRSDRRRSVDLERGREHPRHLHQSDHPGRMPDLYRIPFLGRVAGGARVHYRGGGELPSSHQPRQQAAPVSAAAAGRSVQAPARHGGRREGAKATS